MKNYVTIVVLLGLATGSSAEETPPANDADPRCGLYTLYVGLQALDAEVEPLKEFTSKLGEPPPTGYSLGKLAEAAERYSMSTLGVKTSVENLRRREGRFVCIAHVRGNHYVNIGQIVDGLVSITDPPREYTLPVDTLNSQWDGTALLISPDPLVSEENLPIVIPWNGIITGLVAVAVLLALWAVGRSVLRRRSAGGEAA